MTYSIYALENTKAQLLVSKTHTDSKEVLEVTKTIYSNKGYIVKVDIEN